MRNVVPAATRTVAPVATFICSNLVNAILPDPISDCIVTDVPAATSVSYTHLTLPTILRV